MIPLPSRLDSLDPLATALDALDHNQRVAWMRGLGRGQLRALYELAAGGPPLSVDHFHGAEGEIVHNHGQNSLPAFTVFQKRVVRRGEIVHGFNFQTMSPLTGPGHFLVFQDGPEVLFDYRGLPPDVPEGFPPLAPNDRGLSRLVYGGMVDRVRRVSQHAVIGAAFKGDKAMGAWFMLVREI